MITAERDSFVKQNLGLVHSCANRLRGKGIEYDDLYAAGCVGLLKAMDGFDETRGVMFSTYAVPVILGEIKRLFRDGGQVKVSRSLKELSLRVLRERERFFAAKGREPTLSELAELLEVNTDAVVEALGASLPALSLTQSDEEENGGQLDVPVDGEDENICDRLSVRSLLETLEDRDRKLLLFRYEWGLTQQKTAERLGMTQVQVSRREKKLLLYLRQQLSS